MCQLIFLRPLPLVEGKGGTSGWSLDLTLKDKQTHVSHAKSIAGTIRVDTPLLLPTRGHLKSIKRLMVGDVCVGRGLRQRRWLATKMWEADPDNDNFLAAAGATLKICTYGRIVAIQRFSGLLWSEQTLMVASFRPFLSAWRSWYAVGFSATVCRGMPLLAEVLLRRCHPPSCSKLLPCWPRNFH